LQYRAYDTFSTVKQLLTS